MFAVTNSQLPLLTREGRHPSELTGALTSISGRSLTEVVEEPTTRISSRRSRFGADTGSAPSSRRDATPTPLAAGHELGPYRLLKRLGRGAQGDVWKALRFAPFRGHVALKVLKPALSGNPARMAQFRREAERGVRLVGPSLLPIYELSEFDGYHFMAMPYVEGISLREVIQCRRAHLSGDSDKAIHHLVTLNEPDYLLAMTWIMAQATRALAQVHDQRIVHRDIKPANILLDNDRSGGVYLCDFGLGRDLEVATPEQMRDGAGTPMYMAPERLLRVTADEVKCDIYSMGITLFEALSLERPFQIPDHVSFHSLPAFLAGAEPRRPSAVRAGFPDDLEAIIMKALRRDPIHRHESAYQLAADLDRIHVRWLVRSGRPPLETTRGPSNPRPHAPSRRTPNPQLRARVASGVREFLLRPVCGSDAERLTDSPAG